MSSLWTDKDKGGTATNPIILDSAGKAEVYGDNVYKFEIYDSNDVLIETINGLEYKPVLSITKLSSYNCNLIEAVTAIGAINSTHLIIDCEPDDLTASLVITDNITVEWRRGFPIGGAYTLTLNRDLIAGTYVLFESNITIAGLKTVKPEWWTENVTPGTTNMSTAFTKANAALTNGGMMDLQATTYFFTAESTITKPVWFKGAGRDKTILECEERTAPNSNIASQTILSANGVDNIRFSDITFDGGVSTFINTDFLDPESMVEIINSSGIIFERISCTKYFADLPASYDDATYKIAPFYIYTCDNIVYDDIRFDTPIYGELTMLIDVTDVYVNKLFVDQAGTNIASLVNIWGEATKDVTVQDCISKNHQGSMINLGGLGNFTVRNNICENGKGFDLAEENMWDTYPTHPDIYNILIDGNHFVDPVEYTIKAGDLSIGEDIKTHEVVVTNNTLRVNTGDITGVSVGNADHVIVKGNALNGAKIQLMRCRQATARGNIINGRSWSGANAHGIIVFTRNNNTEQHDFFIKDNEFLNWEDGPILIATYPNSEYNNVNITNNDFIQRTPPTNGQYITVDNAGARLINVLTIDNNRLNNIDYVPLRGTDTEMYYTTLNLGTIQSYTGTFTRDISLASGSQAVTGLGFKPSTLIIFAVEDNGVLASWGFGDFDNQKAVYSKAAVTADTYSYSSNLIRVQDGASDLYSGSLASFDDDGFTINWTKTGSPTGTIGIQYLAIK
jgi:hypothetical protein